MADRSAHIPCPQCKQLHTVVRHGFLKNKTLARFRCKKCDITYSYGSPNVKRNMDQIYQELPGRIANHGIRGLARMMDVSPTTILRWRGKVKETHYSKPQEQQVLSHRNWKYIG